MRSIMIVLLVSLAAFFLIACGGPKATVATSPEPASSEGPPDWYSNPPKDPNYLFAVNSATSVDMQMAMDKATAAARAEIARQVEVNVSALQKRFDEEVGLAENAQLLQQFTQAMKTVVSISLSGSRIEKNKAIKEGTGWRSYVLVSYPLGAANEAMLQQIKNHENMYTRFRASESYKELDEEVQKFLAAKKQLAPTN